MQRPKLALILGLLALTAATAACGGDGDPGVVSVTDPTTSPTTGPLANSTDPLEIFTAYADCMRENGVAEMPDPQQGEDGGVDNGLEEADIDRNSPEFKTADEACNHLLASLEPGGAVYEKRWQALLDHAQCMRDHGVADYIDPEKQGDGGIGQFEPKVAHDDPDYDAAVEACRHLAPGLYAGEEDD